MQHLIHRKPNLHWIALLFIGTCLSAILWPGQASASTGTIADDAGVLNTAAIKQYTDPFSYTVNIFTTNVFQGSNDDFDASVKELTSNDTSMYGSSCDPTQQVGCELFTTQTIPGFTESSGVSSPSTTFLTRNDDADQSVEIGINTNTRHIAIYSGSSVTIPQGNYDNAIQVFATTMHQTHDNYTQATIDALNALQSASDRFWNGVKSALPWIFIGILVIGAIIWSIVARALGIQSSSTGWRNRNWGGGGFGGGGGFSGGGNSGGGGGGGASGNF